MMLSTTFKEIEPYLRERARKHAEIRLLNVEISNSGLGILKNCCSSLSELMERRQDSWVRSSNIERIYNEEEMLLLRQKLCLI